MNSATESKELNPDNLPAPPRRELRLVSRVVAKVDPPLCQSIAKISISDDMFSGRRKQGALYGKTPNLLELAASESLLIKIADSPVSKNAPNLRNTVSATVVAALVLGGMLGYMIGRSRTRILEEA